MSIPFFIPPVTYTPSLQLRSPMTIRELCQIAGISCKASGTWTERQVDLIHGKTIEILAEPGDWGNVRITIPERNKVEKARTALAILAYGIYDVVARESIKGNIFFRIGPPRGRPRTGQALSVKERQRRFRRKRLK